jgi:hypothetical protein
MALMELQTGQLGDEPAAAIGWLQGLIDKWEVNL